MGRRPLPRHHSLNSRKRPKDATIANYSDGQEAIILRDVMRHQDHSIPPSGIGFFLRQM
jgi:hypothetical protein